MEEKLLVILSVPDIDETFDLLIPPGRKIGNLIELIKKAMDKITDEKYIFDDYKSLYNSEDGVKYNNNSLIADTNIKNGTKIILM